MKVALTIWNGRISPVFDVSREAIVVHIAGGRAVSSTRELLAADDHFVRVEQLAEIGVETLICGAVSEPLSRALSARGIRVIGFVAGDVETVLAAFLAGDLPSPELSMPGCCGHPRRRRRRMNHRRRGGNHRSH